MTGAGSEFQTDGAAHRKKNDANLLTVRCIATVSYHLHFPHGCCFHSTYIVLCHPIECCNL